MKDRHHVLKTVRFQNSAAIRISKVSRELVMLSLIFFLTHLTNDNNFFLISLIFTSTANTNTHHTTTPLHFSCTQTNQSINKKA